MSANVPTIEKDSSQELSADAKHLGNVLDCFPQFYGGLEKNIRDTKRGNITVTFSIPEGRRQPHPDRHERALILFQGARNPPTGEYYQLVKELLENGKVDSITVLYPPMLATSELKDPVIDPQGLTDDVKDLRRNGTIAPKAEVVIGGVSVGADLAAFAMRNGVQEEMFVKGILLIAPVTLTEKSTESAIRFYEKARLVFNDVRRAQNRIVATIMQGMTSGAQSLENIIHQYQTIGVNNDFLVKFDMPPNIATIVGTISKTFAMLRERIADPSPVKKVPAVHLYWAATEMKGFSEEVKREVEQMAMQFGEATTIGTLPGSHAEARGAKNKKEYIKAIENILDA